MAVYQAQQYVVSGLDSTRIKLVRRAEEIDSEDEFFHPDMCHQVFGENETIFGYTDLKITILYDAASFNCYVDHSFKNEIEEDNELNVKPENIMELLNPWLPSNFCTTKADFKKLVQEKNKLKPYGNLVASYNNSGRDFEIYSCKSSEPGYQDFHQRLETMIVWFIDAANFIDTNDEKWVFFVLYEKVKEKSSIEYYPIGFCTVYEYFAYPEYHRYRISHFIVFPPYQKVGHGIHLLKGVYKYLSDLPNIYDITVEDPSDKFQYIRDFLDAKSCMTLASFNPKLLKGDFSKEMINEARTHFKINEKQCRRIYEILRLYNTDISNGNKSYAYKIMVKRRLYAPFKKQQNKVNRFYKDNEHRLKIIEKDFQHLMTQYRHVIFRLQHEA